MKKLRLRAAMLCLALLSLPLTACGDTPQSDQPDTAQPQDNTPITLVLDWTPNTNHTGIYAAIDQGYFAEAGLDVQVIQPPDDGAELLVGSGRAQFGISFQDTMAPALIGDTPLPITAVAAILQHNTSGILSRAGEGLDTPKGLEEHRYVTSNLPVEQAILRQVMAADGGSLDQVEQIPSIITDEVSALQSQSVDAIWVFYGWAGMACEVAGLETDYFAFADIDPVFDYYTPVLIANNDYLTEYPNTARAFLEALAKGYTFAIQHPREAADLLMKAAPELAANAELIYASQDYLAGQYQADAAQWGVIDENRWTAFYTWLNDNNLLDTPLVPNAGFTNDYLPAA